MDSPIKSGNDAKRRTQLKPGLLFTLHHQKLKAGGENKQGGWFGGDDEGHAEGLPLNPVIVLIISLIAHETFGVWGMLLGIPVTYYVLNIAQMPSLPRKTHQ